MADHHFDPTLAQAFDHIAFGNVAALHGVAQIVHHLGNPRHPDPADADEVNCADVDQHPLTPSLPEGAFHRPGSSASDG